MTKRGVGKDKMIGDGYLQDKRLKKQNESFAQFPNMLLPGNKKGTVGCLATIKIKVSGAWNNRFLLK